MRRRPLAPLIVKKVRPAIERRGTSHAWKVAYADFVTAMMAFFLLLWLLNVTTDIQKRGIADYFQPTVASRSESGAGGVLGGVTLGEPGAEQRPGARPMPEMTPPVLRVPDDETADDGGRPRTLDEAARAESEERRFAAAQFVLHETIRQRPELRSLADNLRVNETPEGLRVQLIERDRSPLFASGSAELLPAAKRLLGAIAEVIARLPNPVAITGHTDGASYMRAGGYGNWELSADRANAARRALIADGLPPQRIARVVGLADRAPLLPDDPLAAANRRISILVLRSKPEGPEKPDR